MVVDAGLASAWPASRTLVRVTNRRVSLSLTPVRRAAGLLAGLALGAALLAGCSSDGASTDCGLDSCTVTFDRGVEASATILGVEAKLVGAQGDQVTVEIAGEQLSLTVGQQATEAGGFQVSLDSVTDQQVVIRVARYPNG